MERKKDLTWDLFLKKGKTNPARSTDGKSKRSWENNEKKNLESTEDFALSIKIKDLCDKSLKILTFGGESLFGEIFQDGGNEQIFSWWESCPPFPSKENPGKGKIIAQ